MMDVLLLIAFTACTIGFIMSLRQGREIMRKSDELWEKLNRGENNDSNE